MKSVRERVATYDKEKRHEYYEANKEKYAEYRRLNRVILNKNNKTYFAKNPWMKHLDHARERCKEGHEYAERGIKFLLTKQQIKDLWFRDKAYLLKQPSIDRINSKGHYEQSNCRFIELEENRMPKAILQFTPEGKFIKEYKSYGEAERAMGKKCSAICDVANGKEGFSTALGFIWRWKNKCDKCGVELLSFEGIEKIIYEYGWDWNATTQEDYRKWVKGLAKALSHKIPKGKGHKCPWEKACTCYLNYECNGCETYATSEETPKPGWSEEKK